MQMYFQVRSVLLASNESSAITLSPGVWVKDSETETITVNGETFPEGASCDPSDPGAEFVEEGGKMTEFRMDDLTDLRPREFVTLTLEKTVLAPGNDGRGIIPS